MTRTPPTQATTPATATAPTAGHATQMVRQALDAVARAIRVRRDLAQLRQMDDHLLRDIGISRVQAERAVRFGRAA